MIARLREWWREHVPRETPDPEYEAKLAATDRYTARQKRAAIRALQDMGVEYGEINRVIFGRPPWTERRKGERP